MNEHEEDRLESVDLQSSQHSEKMLIDLGAILHNALVVSSRMDEVDLLMDAIGEYATMTSFYGDKTGRIPESLGVDLNEAAILKRNASSEWQVYADQFKNSLDKIAYELGINPPQIG